MPPHATWFRGRDVVAGFLARWPLSGRSTWSVEPTRANGQLAFLHSRTAGEQGELGVHDVTLLTLSGTQIEAMTAFLMPEILPRFAGPAA
jgi:RNA polymerase sigma-70 factor (ECF subfamily)